MNNQPEWEKRFDEQFIPYDCAKENGHPCHLEKYRDAIKSFISQAIESARKEERERIKGMIEGMRRADCNAKICEHWHGCDGDINATLSEALRKIDEI